MEFLFGVYCICVIFSVLVTVVLAHIRGDFPTDKGKHKIHVIWFLPIINLAYGLLLIPYFFSDKPFDIKK